MLRINKEKTETEGSYLAKDTENSNQLQLQLPYDDLFLVTRPTLVFGKFLGIFPFQGLHKLNSDSLPTFKKRNWSALIILAIAVSSVLKAGLIIGATLNLGWSNSTERRISNDKINYTRSAVSQFAIGWLCWYIWSNGEQFCLIFSFWRDQSSQMHFTPQRDNNLKWKANVFLAGVLISAIFENIFSDLKILPQFSELKKGEENMTITEIYYLRGHSDLASILPYNIVVLLILFLLHKISVFSMNIIAILLSIMAYALGQKFKHFVQEISGKLEESIEFGELELEPEPEIESNVTVLKIPEPEIRKIKNTPIIDWCLVRQDYFRLCQLVHKIDEFASPLIFHQVSTVVEWICLTIYCSLTPSKLTVLEQTYTIWAFIHLTSRILILTLSANVIIEESQNFQNILENCPKDEYCQEIERLERLVSRPAGFTGLRCFTLSRSLILSLVNVIFTIVIVMLQASGGNQSINGNDEN